IEEGDLRVGGLAVVRITEAAAEADDRNGHALHTQAPAGLVHFMHALVAEIAVAVIPNPVPVVVDGAELGIAVGGLERGRAAPQVVVHGGRRNLVALDLADRRTVLVAKADGQIDLANLAALNRGDGFAHAGIGAALRADLTNPPELAGRGEHHRPFLHVVRRRLLHINVFTILHGPDRHQRVPVVRRGDGYDVDVLVFNDLADVFHVRRRLALLARDSLHRAGDDGFIAIADGGNLAVVALEEAGNVAHAPAAHAQDGHAEAFIGGSAGHG